MQSSASVVCPSPTVSAYLELLRWGRVVPFLPDHEKGLRPSGRVVASTEKQELALEIADSGDYEWLVIRQDSKGVYSSHRGKVNEDGDVLVVK